ncbi:MAG: hypothetical protein Q7S09_04215 [bacterium]|nr:hypothetical protein [bacterium]
METSDKTVPEVRQDKNKEHMLDKLRKLPIIEAACREVGIGRASYYRYRKDDPEFAKAADDAIAHGEDFISDMSETQLIALIKDRNIPAISMWLRAHRAKYSTKVEISGSVKSINESLTPEQESAVQAALKLASLAGMDPEPEKNHESVNPKPEGDELV